MSAPTSLRFGALTLPVHRPEHDPTLQLQQDIELAELADRLGMHEFWWGEHHSGGWQVIADPLLMVARASATTRTIKLGTGVSALALHHPKTLLDSAIQLDHLTRGRLMLGVGAGALTRDSTILGLDPMEARQAMAESLDAMLALLEGRRPVTITPRHAPWLLREAYLHLLPYDGPLDIRVAAFQSPAGPALAGRYGLGMLSPASSAPPAPGGTHRLAELWAQASAVAARHDVTMPRALWSVASPMHLAATEIEARRQVRYGLLRYLDYARDVLPSDLPTGRDVDAVVDALHASGTAVVGTPAMAVEHIERVLEHSEGVGTFLVELADWASTADTRTGLELFAREVVPHFRGSTRMRVEAYAREVERSMPNRDTVARAQDVAQARYVEEMRTRPARHASDLRPVDHIATPAGGLRRPLPPTPARAPGGPSRSPLDRIADAAGTHAATPARGFPRPRHEPAVPRISTDELGPMPADPPRRRGRHSMD